MLREKLKQDENGDKVDINSYQADEFFSNLDMINWYD